MDPCSLHLGRTQHWASQRNNQSSGVIDCPSCPFIHQFVHLLIDCKIRQRKKPDLGNAAGTWGHWRQYVDLSWTPLWLNFAETGFNPQAADVSCFYFPGVNSSHSFFILLDILHHDRFSRSLDSWRKLIFNALSEAFMADHRTYTICSGFRTGSLPACWKMYHSRQSGCFMVARYGQVSWSRFGGLNMPEYLYIYSLLRSLLGTLGMMAKWSRSKSYYCQLVYLWNPLNIPTSINVSSIPVVHPLGTSPFFPPDSTGA